MRVYVHTLTVKVVTLDSNPASVAATIDGRLDDARTDHPLGRILTTSTEATNTPSQQATIPDEPLAEDGWAHDAWWNEHVYEVMRAACYPDSRPIYPRLAPVSL